jgi:lysophospholipase L1-like esterase
MKRILVAVEMVILVFGSLIVFPAYIHWLVFAWLVLSLVAFGRDKRMWPWLVGCILIVAIKRPGFTPEFLILAIAFLAVAYADWRSYDKKPQQLNLRLMLTYSLILIVAISWFGLTRWFAANTSQTLIADNRPIACLGDSLTDFGYPQQLEKLISAPIADFGVNGITTDDGIKMIPEILAANPQLVILELGGHDYNADKKTRAETKENLIKLIEAFLKNDVMVVLVEIPRGFISDPYDGLERELSAKYDLQLIDDSLIRSFVFNSPILPPGMWLAPVKRYSDDGLHPNEMGNKHFAHVVCKSLAKIFGDSILN